MHRAEAGSWIQAGDLVDGSGTCFTASRTSTLEEDSPPFAQLGGGLMKVRGALFQVSEILEFTQIGKATGEWRVNRKLSSKRRILRITLIPCHGR